MVETTTTGLLPKSFARSDGILATDFRSAEADLPPAAQSQSLVLVDSKEIKLPNCQRSIPNAKTSPIGLRQISLRRTKNPEPIDTPLADRSLQVLKILRIGGRLSMEPNDFFLTAFKIRPSQLRCSFDSTNLESDNCLAGWPNNAHSLAGRGRSSDAIFPSCHNRRRSTC